ncbi:nuclear transport factor 2 family protein [Nocardioides sp. AE5]|uniref:nuclear transport factor 2 family protein n=1 Tax=Nocardioides sp. AE5 TaxID=2962573 RepID=UPI002880C255|nr:nuclear transport factor 2 family protein [Nocardioides sp. AE5]MDT0200597.1 nuclear transport factor 2 family protein [Nocardioides sp. AE5]
MEFSQALEPVGGSVEEVHRAFYSAWEQGDAAAALDLWVDSDDVSVLFPGGEPVWGREAVRAEVAEGIRLTRGIQFFFEQLRVVEHGEVARLTCVENVAGPEAFVDGFELPAARIAVSSTYLHTDAGWRIWSHASGPVLFEVER